MLILSEQQIRSIYTIKDAINDLKESIVSKVNGNVKNPLRTVIEFPKKKASALYMPSSNTFLEKMSVKIVTIFPDNPKKGLKTTQGVIVLSDANSGEHVALLNATYLTRVRTGALSAIATEKLARIDSSILCVIGCGAMAEEQLLGILEVSPIQKIYLYNRTIEKAYQFAERVKLIAPHFKGIVEVVDDPNIAVRHSHIVICSTRSETPVFSGDSLMPGTHINGIGSYLPNMQEVDEKTLLKCSKIVVDTIEGVKEEAGDFIIPVNKGVWSFSNIHGEIGDLLVGNVEGRKNDNEITFFKSVGMAYFDLAVAAGVYQKATKHNVGTRVEL